MSDSENRSYRFISVHEDDQDEFVVHAGAAPRSEGERAHAAVASVADGAFSQGAGSQGAGPQGAGERVAAVSLDEHAAGGFASDANAAYSGNVSVESVQRDSDPRREALRRQAEELAQAEENLRDPQAFSHMRHVILAVLAVAVVVFVAYFCVRPALL